MTQVRHLGSLRSDRAISSTNLQVAGAANCGINNWSSPRGPDAMRTLVVSTFALLLLTNVALSQQGRESGENSNTWIEKQDAAAWRAAEEQKK